MTDIREGKCWTLRDLAVASGVAHETVRRVEAGMIPTPRVQFALAKAYGVEPTVIVPLGARRWVKR